MNLLKRVLQLIEKEGISLNKFSLRISQNSGYISRQKQNNGSVGGEALEKICNEFPDWNPVWILTGKGEMYNSAYLEVGVLDEVKEPDGLYKAIAEKDREINYLKKAIQNQQQLIDLQQAKLDKLSK